MSFRPGSKASERKKGFKKAIDADEARRKREGAFERRWDRGRRDLFFCLKKRRIWRLFKKRFRRLSTAHLDDDDDAVD